MLLLSDDATLLAEWKRVATAATARNALPGRPLPEESGLVLLDADLLRKQRLSVSSALAMLPGRRVVLADAQHNDNDGLTALRAGCAGYCHAFMPLERLQTVLAVVAAGELWAGRELLMRLLQAASAAAPAATIDWRSKLSEREASVAELAAQGLANKTIADRLGITVRTVKAHLSASFAKLDVRDRVQLLVKLRGG